MTKETLEQINRFTRRPLAEEEVYTFSVILCDNDIDRDLERFSDSALDTLKESFIGRTGISDHNAAAANQNARIFAAEVVSDSERTTADGRPYKYLKGEAYMVRTDDNKNLIAEIDGGIKKEVSISCSAAKRICSVCGCDRSKGGCSHEKGKLYGGKLCHTILDDITDAYEWSFVAVPAQVNAGVTKKFTEGERVFGNVPRVSDDAADELRRDIRRLAFFAGGRTAADIASLSAKTMNTEQLISFKRSFEKKCRGGIKLQLESSGEADSVEGFTV
jgi:hypothetical protein